MLGLNMFKSPAKQWEIVLTKPFQKQCVFLNKVCKVNKNDRLIIREAFFENLSFDLVKKIFKLVDDVVDAEKIDYSFKELIQDRLLWITKIAHLYIRDVEAEENIISGEEYNVYSACYYDLDIVSDFINSREDIHSLCDMGSGSGRALLYIILKATEHLECVGLELVNNRVEFTNSIAKHFGLKNLFFKTSDFLENPQDFSGFDAYYLYDPVGTDDVSLLISHFEKMIADGEKFYILFISGWDDLLLNALDKLETLERIESNKSRKQIDRYVNFYKVI